MNKIHFTTFDAWQGEIVDFLLFSQIGGILLKYLSRHEVELVGKFLPPLEIENLRYLFRSTLALYLERTMVSVTWITLEHARIHDSDDETFLGNIDIENNRVCLYDYIRDSYRYIYLIVTN